MGATRVSEESEESEESLESQRQKRLGSEKKSWILETQRWKCFLSSLTDWEEMTISKHFCEFCIWIFTFFIHIIPIIFNEAILLILLQMSHITAKMFTFEEKKALATNDVKLPQSSIYTVWAQIF